MALHAIDDEEEEEQEDSDDDEVMQLVTTAVQCNAQIPAIAIMAWMRQAKQHCRRRSTRRRRAQEATTAPRIPRNPTLFDERLQWDVFVRKFGGRAEFKRHLRMSYDSFTRLLSHIRPSLEVDAEMARRRGGQIHPELCLYACLRFLAGGSYSDLNFLTGMEY